MNVFVYCGYAAATSCKPVAMPCLSYWVENPKALKACPISGVRSKSYYLTLFHICLPEDTFGGDTSFVAVSKKNTNGGTEMLQALKT